MKILKQSRTCLAAIRTKKGKIYLAGDRRASWDFSQAQAMPRAKINKRDGLILGGTGDGFLCGLIVDMMTIPELDVVRDTDVYMFQIFRQAVYKILKTNGFVEEHGLLKIPMDMSVEILVVISGKLYNVIICNPEPDNINPNGLILIDELSLPYATGCGGALAWGSLLTSQRIDEQSKKEHLKVALEVASEVSPGCDSNIDILGE